MRDYEKAKESLFTLCSMPLEYPGHPHLSNLPVGETVESMQAKYVEVRSALERAEKQERLMMLYREYYFELPSNRFRFLERHLDDIIALEEELDFPPFERD